MKKRHIRLIVSLVAVVGALIFLGASAGCARAGAPQAGSLPTTAAEWLSLGEKYLLELEYEQAVVAFTRVIEIEPRNARGYTGAAEAYAGLGRMDEAAQVLRDGLLALPGDTELQTLLDRLADPEIAQEQTSGTTPGYEPPIRVQDDVRDTISRIAEALVNREFWQAWELGADSGLIAFLLEVEEYKAANNIYVRFKCADVVFNTNRDEILNYQRAAATLIRTNDEGDGIFFLPQIKGFGFYEPVYPYWEVYDVQDYMLTGNYESFDYLVYPTGDRMIVETNQKGQVIDGKWEGILTTQITYADGSVRINEEEWSNGSNERHERSNPGSAMPTDGLHGYVQGVALAPNW